MAEKAIRWGDWIFGLAALAGTLWLMASVLVPPSVWLDVRSVYVSDTTQGDLPIIAVDREVHNPFRAEYVVSVRNATNAQIICTGTDTVNYRRDSTLPDPTTLGWWLGPNAKCNIDGPFTSVSQIPAGKYFVESCWFIFPSVPFLPEKKTCRESNIFAVIDPSASQERLLQEQQVLQEQLMRLDQELKQLKSE